MVKMAHEAEASYLYFHQRVHTLFRALGNQERLEATLMQPAPRLVNCGRSLDGPLRRIAVDARFVAAHRKLVGTLVADLLAWGPAGRDAVALLAPDFVHDCP